MPTTKKSPAQDPPIIAEEVVVVSTATDTSTPVKGNPLKRSADLLSDEEEIDLNEIAHIISPQKASEITENGGHPYCENVDRVKVRGNFSVCVEV